MTEDKKIFKLKNPIPPRQIIFSKKICTVSYTYNENNAITLEYI